MNDKQLYYFIHPESDDIFISYDWLVEKSNDGCVETVGECNERSLEELKSVLEPSSWVYKVYTDYELVKKLDLRLVPAPKKIEIPTERKKPYDITKHRTFKYEVVAYSDGSCYAKTGVGGIGVYMISTINGEVFEKRVSIGYENTKIGRMELTGINTAMELILPEFRRDTKLIVYCDSQYAVNCIAKRWIWRWEKAKELKNRTNGDLLVKMKELHDSFPKGNVLIRWLKGHDDNEGNEEADRLAGLASKSGTYIKDVW